MINISYIIKILLKESLYAIFEFFKEKNPNLVNNISVLKYFIQNPLIEDLFSKES